MWSFSIFHKNWALEYVYDRLRATMNISLGFCAGGIKSFTEIKEIRLENMLITSLFIWHNQNATLVPRIV